MELTPQDVGYIVNKLGYSMLEIAQIKAALRKTKITKETSDGKRRRISPKEARKILGDKQFLSGISRSAFHFTSMRKAEDGTEVLFDAYPYFKSN